MLYSNMTQMTLSGGIARSPWDDRDRLRELYHDEELSIREIATHFDYHHTIVFRAMQDHRIDQREGSSEGERIAVPFVTRRDGYEYWRPDARLVLAHRLLAVAEYGFDAVADSVVHHNNGIRFDNRRENIEVVENPRDHGRLHARVSRQSDENRQLTENYS